MPQVVPDPTTITTSITTRQGFAQALTTRRERVRHTPAQQPTEPAGTPGDGTAPPYRGLASFQPEDAEWFFGREELVDALVSRVAASARRLAVGTAHGLVVVVGASGSGKSSLLRAGLIPALERGAVGGQAWSWLLLTPAANPSSADPSSELAHRLDADTTADADLVVVVDQFEQLFTACPDEQRQRDYVTRLLSLSQHRTGRTVVVAGLRADFYGHATRLPGLVPALQDSQLVVGPMNAGQLRRAITEPARKADLTLEAGLVDVVLRSLAPTPVGTATGWTSGAAHDPGALPLLSHALLATWQRRQDSTLRIADLVATGGIDGAVARTADEVYQALTPEQRDAARRLFRQLVCVADGAADTRRRVSFSDWGPQADDPASPLRVALEEFVGHRLLTTDLDGVEITHDALLTAWPLLRSWVDADRVGLSTHRQVTQAALAWEDAGHDPQNLHRGGRLAAALEWAGDAERADELSPMEETFLTAGRERADAERQAGQRTTRRLRWLAAALATLLLVVAALAGYAFRLQSQAGQERDLATSRQLAGQAQQLRPDDPARAAQLAVLAYRTADTTQARSAVLDLAAMPLAGLLAAPPGVLQSVSVAAAGQLVAAGGEKGVVRLWSVPTDGRPRLLADLPAGDARATVFATAFSPDGRVLAAAGGDHRVYLWDVTTADRPTSLGQPLAGATNTVYTLAFSPSGTVLAAGSADRTVRLWDLRNPAAARPLGAPITAAGGFVRAVTFSRDGKLLAAGGADRAVRLWDVSRPASPAPVGGGPGVPLTGAASAVRSVTLSPDGRTVAAATQGRKVVLWNLGSMPRAWPKRAVRALAPARVLTGPGNGVNGVAFAPDGKRLAAASSDGKIWVWDAATGTLQTRLPHPAAVTAVTWRGNGTLFSSSADGSARRWSLPAARPAAPGPVGQLDGASTLGPDGTLWNVDPDRAVARICASAGDPISPQDWQLFAPGLPYRAIC